MDLEDHFARPTIRTGGMNCLTEEKYAHWHCLTCGTKIHQWLYEQNNGTCDECPKLTAISPQFWAVLSKQAALGDFDAKKTFEVYG